MGPYNFTQQPYYVGMSRDFNFEEEINARMNQLQSMKDQFVQAKQANINSLWVKIDEEIRSLTDDQRNILFSSSEYIEIDTQLKLLVQEAMINSVKGIVENSDIGNKILNRQLAFIRNNKNQIIAESKKELEVFKAFQIAAKTNPNLTYAEFIKPINK